MSGKDPTQAAGTARPQAATEYRTRRQGARHAPVARRAGSTTRMSHKLLPYFFASIPPCPGRGFSPFPGGDPGAAPAPVTGPLSPFRADVCESTTTFTPVYCRLCPFILH